MVFLDEFIILIIFICYISTFNCGLICEHLLFVQYKTKTKKVSGFHNIFSRIFKILQQKAFKHKFLKFLSFINLPWGPKQTSVLASIGYKQTNRQAKFIYRRMNE